MTPRWISLAILSLAALFCIAAPERLAPGLTLTLETSGQSDMRDARMASLYVPADSPPSPFLPPGPFRAVWEGYVGADLKSEYVFSAEGRGGVTVTINDGVALESKDPDLSKAEGKPVTLRKGKNKIAVRYASPAKGDASIRLFWSSSDLPRETVPPDAFSHDADAAPLKAARQLREGRELISSRRCLRCHTHEIPSTMPDLAVEGPSLVDAGARMNAAWLAAWIRNPRAFRPNASMPAGSKDDAADIAAYLASLGAPPPAEPAPSPELLAQGGHLFAIMRCIGCHTLPDGPPAPGRVPLHYLVAKWKPAALHEFLINPEQFFAWRKMPNFHLTNEEAAALTAFLLSRSNQKLESDGIPKGDPERGRKRIESAGCLNCHPLPLTNSFRAPALKAIPPEGWKRGCMAAEERGKAPDLSLTAAEREALAAFAATDRASLSREAGPEFAARQIKTLRCQACHKRDDQPDLSTEVQAETESLVIHKPPDPDEPPKIVFEPVVPSLTWIGEKLKPEWSADFLAGRIKNRPRPWFELLRMPSFPARAGPLAAGMALDHGCPPTSAPEPAPDPKLADIGLQLTGKNGGLGCTACHDVGPGEAVGVFEAPGPNLARVRDRLRKDYFLRWMQSPFRFDPGTKMPQFSPGGRSQFADILDGDATRQYEAIWHYLLEGDKIRFPRD